MAIPATLVRRTRTRIIAGVPPPVAGVDRKPGSALPGDLDRFPPRPLENRPKPVSGRRTTRTRPIETPACVAIPRSPSGVATRKVAARRPAIEGTHVQTPLMRVCHERAPGSKRYPLVPDQPATPARPTDNEDGEAKGKKPRLLGSQSLRSDRITEENRIGLWVIHSHEARRRNQRGVGFEGLGTRATSGVE